MSYERLRGLYLGLTSNADLTTDHERHVLHVPTKLDELVPRWLAEGKDVTLTGNPGDGKSHLARRLVGKKLTGAAEVILDLSATPTPTVLGRWGAAVAEGRPTLLCANEGPLKALLPELRAAGGALARRGLSLAAQLNRLTVSRPEELAARPEELLLVDLADRDLLDANLIRRALQHLCLPEHLPPHARADELSSGRNLRLFMESDVARDRLARLLVAAGARLRRHVTFRQLWGALAYTITAGKPMSALTAELRGGEALGSLPLDHLTSGDGQLELLDAARRWADPATVAAPALDEALWLDGRPPRADGDWLTDRTSFDAKSPARLWAAGHHAEALRRMASLKRIVALAHEAGEALISAVVEGDQSVPSRFGDEALLQRALTGLRRLFVSPRDEVGAPAWLVTGLPLWCGHSYQDEPAEERPHVAVAVIAADALRVLRPVQAPWLGEALGRPPEVAWLEHAPSRVTLRLDAQLLDVLGRAADSDGPMPVPEPVQRFLARLSGWEEAQPRAAESPFVVIERPRGALMSDGLVLDATTSEARYAARR